MKLLSSAEISCSLFSPFTIAGAPHARAVSLARKAAAPASSHNAPSEDEGAATPADSAKAGGAGGGAGGGNASGGAPKKRVRLKPETPEQLIERLRNPQLSLHEASILLRVSRATVRRYADSGRLNCQRTPGGQRRFFLRDIENFYRQLKLKR